MLGWGLWVLRYSVYSARKYAVFSHHNKGYNIVFFFRRYWVYMFASQEIFIKLTSLRKRRLASLKYKLKETLFAFLAKSAVQELKKMSDERLRKLRKTLFWEIVKKICIFWFQKPQKFAEWNNNTDAPK